MNWMRKWFGKTPDQQALKEAKAHAEQLLALVKVLDAEIALLKAQFQAAASAQATLSRRANQLQRDWPDIWKRYFTKQGEADRAMQEKKKSTKAVHN